MVSLFPDLLSFALVAPFIIRLCLGFYFLLYGLRLFKNSPNITLGIHKGHILGMLAFVGSILVLVGLFTQAAAILLALLSLYRIKRSQNKILYALLFGMALSLLFSGAGLFAFDLPL
ncbi:MAG: hypothetical protein HYT27_00770 [Parcubacteria group bacterium]|nr:hypothetical protein [Parcubacteria group bacterium]